MLNMVNDGKRFDNNKDRNEITVEEKAGKEDDKSKMDKHESEQLEEGEIQEHPEH